MLGFDPRSTGLAALALAACSAPTFADAPDAARDAAPDVAASVVAPMKPAMASDCIVSAVASDSVQRVRTSSRRHRVAGSLWF